MRRFDAQHAKPLGRAVRVAPRSTSAAPLSTPDGRLLVSSDRATYAVDAEALRVVRRYPVGALTNGLSADGSTLAIEGVDGSLRVLDLSSGRVRTLAGAAAGVSPVPIVVGASVGAASGEVCAGAADGLDGASRRLGRPGGNGSGMRATALALM